MKIFNLHGDERDRTEDREGWRSKDAWVRAHVGSELTGGSLYELVPGDRLWPYPRERGVARPGPMLDYWDGEE